MVRSSVQHFFSLNSAFLRGGMYSLRKCITRMYIPKRQRPSLSYLPLVGRWACVVSTCRSGRCCYRLPSHLPGSREKNVEPNKRKRLSTIHNKVRLIPKKGIHIRKRLSVSSERGIYCLSSRGTNCIVHQSCALLFIVQDILEETRERKRAAPSSRSTSSHTGASEPTWL